MFGRHVEVSAGIEQEDRRVERKRRSDRGAGNAADPADDHRSPGDKRPGITGGHESVRFPVRESAQTVCHRGMVLFTEDRHRLVLHRNHVGRVEDPDPGKIDPVFFRDPFQFLLLSDGDKFGVETRRGGNDPA